MAVGGLRGRRHVRRESGQTGPPLLERSSVALEAFAVAAVDTLPATTTPQRRLSRSVGRQKSRWSSVRIGLRIRGPRAWRHRLAALPAHDALAAVTLPFITSRLLLVAATALVASLRDRSPLRLWGRLDASWYVGIATHGYRWHIHWGPGRESSLAFFPLYPLIVHIGTVLPLHAVLVGMLVSNIAFAASLLYLYALTAGARGKPAATTTIWLVCAFPTAFFTFAPYSESVFLLCAAGALYHARQGQVGLAALWVGTGVIARPTGLILVPAVIAALGCRRRRDVTLLLAAAAGSIGVYELYLTTQHIALTAQLHAQEGWHRSLTVPWTGFERSVQWLLSHGASNPSWAAEDLLQLGTTVVFLVLTAAAWPHLSLPERVYCAGFWLLVLLTPEWRDGYHVPFNSMVRFVLLLFPLMTWTSTRITPGRLPAVLALSSGAMILAAEIHLFGGWVG